MSLRWACILVCGFSLTLGAAQARPLRVACAASLTQELTQRLADHEVQIIPGATGKLSQQIALGAPFDLFLAADALRPAQLREQALTQECQTFSTGRLVAWSPKSAVPKNWPQLRLAIAEPRLAPYGAAAQQALQALGAWDEQRLIRGQNVSHAMQFAASGHVPVALISAAQAQHAGSGSWLEIDPKLYRPIQHQLCLLNNAQPGSRALWQKLLHNPE